MVFLIMTNLKINSIVFFFLFHFHPNAIAQSSDPCSINVSGGSKIIGPYSWDWSFGEPFMFTKINAEPNLLITSGFLQNDLLFGLDASLLSNRPIPFVVGPNPTQNTLTIKLAQLGVTILNIEIRNQAGNLFKIIQGPFSGLHFFQEIAFDSANTGIYFILIHYVVANERPNHSVYKIIKN